MISCTEVVSVSTLYSRYYIIVPPSYSISWLPCVLWTIFSLYSHIYSIDILLYLYTLSYASPLVWKLHPRNGVTSKTYKPAFYGVHLSCNTSYGSAAIIWVFYLPWWRYSYLTRSSMTELLLSVSQH